MKWAAWLLLLIFPLSGLVFAQDEMNDYQKAVKFFQEEQYNESIEVLQRILRSDPNQAPVYNLLGLIYLRQGESVQSAIGSFEQAIRTDPNYAEAYFNLASTYAGPGNQPERAAENFKKTLEVDPNYIKAHFGLGWFTLTEKQDPIEAAKHFQKAIESFPDFAEAYYGLGLSYVQMGKAPMALETVSQLRNMGREDLASYLETAVRGEAVDGNFSGDTGTSPSQSDQGPAREMTVAQGAGQALMNEDFSLLDSDRK
ncbi:MAG: tetratricopeptide repeat protein [Candidatus Omnitrophota bacterium]